MSSNETSARRMEKPKVPDVDPDPIEEPGLLEQALLDLRSQFETALIEWATDAGSQVQGYAAVAYILAQGVGRISLMFWSLVLLPYTMIGALLEYVVRHTPYFMPIGAVALFLIAAPPAAVALATYLRYSKWRASSSVLADPTVVPFPKRPTWPTAYLVMKRAPLGLQVWLWAMVGSSVLIMLAVEVGHRLGVGVLDELHGMWLAAPTVIALDAGVNSLVTAWHWIWSLVR